VVITVTSAQILIAAETHMLLKQQFLF